MSNKIALFHNAGSNSHEIWEVDSANVRINLIGMVDGSLGDEGLEVLESDFHDFWISRINTVRQMKRKYGVVLH